MIVNLVLYTKHGFCPPSRPIIIGGRNMKICQNFVGTKFFHFSYISRGINHSELPEKWSVSGKNFFRKCECISSYYLPISSHLLKNSFRKNSLFVLFELLPTGLPKYVWPFVTAQHEWVNNFSGFFCKNINEKVGKLV